MTEAQEQKLLFQWLAFYGNQHPEARLMFHIPNGGSRNAIEGKHLKEQGVKAGVPDLFLPVARNGCHGLFIEMKRTSGGRLSRFQSEMLMELMLEGYRCAVCHGYEEAKKIIEEYLEGEFEC